MDAYNIIQDMTSPSYLKLYVLSVSNNCMETNS